MSLITDLTSTGDGTTADLFSWERSIQRSWTELEIDQYGILEHNKLQLNKQLRQKQKLDTKYNSNNIRTNLIEKGMIRFVYIVIDCTDSMNKNDFKPTRKLCILELLKQFIIEYFDQNPISQLGIITTYNSIAYKLTELSGNPQQQIQRLTDYLEHGIVHDNSELKETSGGEMSLQNSLLVAERTLKQIPSYGSREIIIIHSTLYTVDPTDIYQTIDSIVKNNITCNIISLTAEMYICTLLAQRTSGTFNVSLNKQHLKELLFSYISPSPLLKQRIAQIQRHFIKMGFPTQLIESYPTLCACHQLLKYGGFQCPKCQLKYCELPTECIVCNTTLILSPHLARTYHHLFPVQPYILLDKHSELTVKPTKSGIDTDVTVLAASVGTMESSTTQQPDDPLVNDERKDVDIIDTPVEPIEWPDIQCYSCMTVLQYQSSIRNQCPKCQHIFCIDCDEYIHTSLHNCPGCASSIEVEQVTAVTADSTETPMEVT